MILVDDKGSLGNKRIIFFNKHLFLINLFKLVKMRLSRCNTYTLHQIYKIQKQSGKLDCPQSVHLPVSLT